MLTSQRPKAFATSRPQVPPSVKILLAKIDFFPGAIWSGFDSRRKESTTGASNSRGGNRVASLAMVLPHRLQNHAVGFQE